MQLINSSNNRIREIREALKMRKTDFAIAVMQFVDISPPMLARYEAPGYNGTIREAVKRAIAEVLRQPMDIVFPIAPVQTVIDSNPQKFDRRHFIYGAGMIGAMIGGLAASSIVGIPLSHSRRSRNLSQDEIRFLIDGNFTAWQMADALHSDTSIYYVQAIAHGKLVTLNQLITCPLPGNQHRLLLILMGDTALLLARIACDIRDFHTSEAYFQQAFMLAREAQHAELLAAAHMRYSNLLLSDQRLVEADQNAQAILATAHGTAFPIQNEALVTAANVYIRIGKLAEAERLGAIAADAQPGPDPEIWVGKITNPKASHEHLNFTRNLACRQFDEAIQAADEIIQLTQREEPENLKLIAYGHYLSARAHWGNGTVEAAIEAAQKSLILTDQIDAVKNRARLESLYTSMIASPLAKHRSVREFGEHLASSQPVA